MYFQFNGCGGQVVNSPGDVQVQGIRQGENQTQQNGLNSQAQDNEVKSA
jgi:hypothetical protein